MSNALGIALTPNLTSILKILEGYDVLADNGKLELDDRLLDRLGRLSDLERAEFDKLLKTNEKFAAVFYEREHQNTRLRYSDLVRETSPVTTAPTISVQENHGTIQSRDSSNPVMRFSQEEAEGIRAEVKRLEDERTTREARDARREARLVADRANTPGNRVIDLTPEERAARLGQARVVADDRAAGRGARPLAILARQEQVIETRVRNFNAAERYTRAGGAVGAAVGGGFAAYQIYDGDYQGAAESVGSGLGFWGGAALGAKFVPIKHPLAVAAAGLISGTAASLGGGALLGSLVDNPEPLPQGYVFINDGDKITAAKVGSGWGSEEGQEEKLIVMQSQDSLFVTAPSGQTLEIVRGADEQLFVQSQGKPETATELMGREEYEGAKQVELRNKQPVTAQEFRAYLALTGDPQQPIPSEGQAEQMMQHRLRGPKRNLNEKDVRQVLNDAGATPEKIAEVFTQLSGGSKGKDFTAILTGAGAQAAALAADAVRLASEAAEQAASNVTGDKRTAAVTLTTLEVLRTGERPTVESFNIALKRIEGLPAGTDLTKYIEETRGEIDRIASGRVERGEFTLIPPAQAAGAPAPQAAGAPAPQAAGAPAPQAAGAPAPQVAGAPAPQAAGAPAPQVAGAPAPQAAGAPAPAAVENQRNASNAITVHTVGRLTQEQQTALAWNAINAKNPGTYKAPDHADVKRLADRFRTSTTDMNGFSVQTAVESMMPHLQVIHQNNITVDGAVAAMKAAQGKEISSFGAFIADLNTRDTPAAPGAQAAAPAPASINTGVSPVENTVQQFTALLPEEKARVFIFARDHANAAGFNLNNLQPLSISMQYNSGGGLTQAALDADQQQLNEFIANFNRLNVSFDEAIGSVPDDHPHLNNFENAFKRYDIIKRNDSQESANHDLAQHQIEVRTAAPAPASRVAPAEPAPAAPAARAAAVTEASNGSATVIAAVGNDATTPEGAISIKTGAAIPADTKYQTVLFRGAHNLTLKDGAGKDLSPAQVQAAIVQLQRDLKDLGHYKGEPDGIFGPATEKAVIALQEEARIGVDGIAGEQTVLAIQLMQLAQAEGAADKTREAQEANAALDKIDPALFKGLREKFVGLAEAAGFEFKEVSGGGFDLSPKAATAGTTEKGAQTQIS